MFSGTLRENMDPFNQFTDEDLITSLRDVGIQSFWCNFTEGNQKVRNEIDLKDSLDKDCKKDLIIQSAGEIQVKKI